MIESNVNVLPLLHMSTNPQMAHRASTAQQKKDKIYSHPTKKKKEKGTTQRPTARYYRNPLARRGRDGNGSRMFSSNHLG